MDIVDRITEEMRNRLIDDWGYIPFSELENDLIDGYKFNLDCWREYIDSSELNMEDFYYRPGFAMVYYRGFVYYDIFGDPTDTNWEVEINGLLIEARKMLEAGNYSLLFGLFMDKRIALDIFLLMLDDLPEDQIYELFKDVYGRTEYGFNVLTDEDLNYFRACRLEPLSLPGANDEGFVEVYRGMSSRSTDIDEAYSWTLNPATAVYFACRFLKTAGIGEVYRMYVHQDKVVAYLCDRGEEEVIIIPSENQDEILEAEVREFWELNEIRTVLDENAYLSMYESFLGFIDEKDFSTSSLHGLDHTKRVLLLTMCLSYLLELDANDVCLLAIAALYHDIGRIDDGEDSTHGVQSFAKALDKPLLGLYAPDICTIQYIIENHCIGDSSAFENVINYGVNDPEHAVELLKVFKDADGLDRFRIRDLDARKLRHPEAIDLLVVAWELLQESKGR